MQECDMTGMCDKMCDKMCDMTGKTAIDDATHKLNESTKCVKQTSCLDDRGVPPLTSHGKRKRTHGKRVTATRVDQASQPNFLQVYTYMSTGRHLTQSLGVLAEYG